MRHVFPLSILTLCLVAMLVEKADAQSVVEGLDMVHPRDFSVKDLYRELALLNPKSPVENMIRIDRPMIANVVRFQQEVLIAESKSLVETLDELKKRLSETEQRFQIYEAEIVDVVDKAMQESSLPVTNQSTTDLLLQNCLVELQRLQWEIASEKELAKLETAKPNTRVAEAQLRAQQTQLESGRQQVESISEKLEKVLLKVRSGEVSAELVDETKRQLETERAKLALAEAALVEAQVKLESQNSPATSESATKLAQLTAREAAVLKQVEQLNKQRTAFEAASRLKAEMEHMRNRASRFDERLIDAELQKSERDRMLNSIQGALQKFEESEKPEKPAEDSPDAK